MRIWIFLITSLLFHSCRQDHYGPWKIVLHTNKEGVIQIGNKSVLINAIRQGSDIKIGWGAKGKSHTIEHISTPIWLAVLDEKEVIARLDPQVGSKVDWDNLNSTYANRDTLNEEWRVIISTKGDFDAVWIDRNTSSVIKRIPQNHPMTWYAKGYNPNSENTPLFN